MANLTKLEREMMLHALGRDYPHKAPDFRNYYNVSRGGPDDLAWSGLVDRHLAERWLAGDLVYYRVSAAGLAVLDGVCGARPRGGDGTVWCDMARDHLGFHHGDGISFTRAVPGTSWRARQRARGRVARLTRP